jgi:hypothetical protein
MVKPIYGRCNLTPLKVEVVISKNLLLPIDGKVPDTSVLPLVFPAWHSHCRKSGIFL